ncbi:DUF3450 domain-containing protein [Desulforhopalus singaporensis]|uniref:DUF3450 domain-containing protein n=1 Tax=Desulforhopalus singaporensis TaxID=91360 RepID=A0A1H0SIU0_9BACT|nr:DUF3450 domain-containing protein [Desulforhopalus singaporensis]SDP41585.1 Protein of unknown function [Desulforhopalus singaporensis]
MESRIYLSLIFICSLQLAYCLPVLATGVEQEVVQPVKEAIALRQTTQKQEEQWRAEKEELTSRLDQLLSANKELTGRKTDLERQVDGARERIALKTKQLDDIGRITDEISPVTNQLYERLEAVVVKSLPFLPLERKKRIAALRPILTDPSVPISERYRKVMEAFLVETEYGFTCDVYQQTIDVNGHPILVDIFRLGRLALFYLTLDKKRCGHYNVAADSWQPLSLGYLPQMKKAVAIGLKQMPVELLDLPIGRMVKQ